MHDAHYTAPTPRIFYIHDDLSAYVRQRHGEGSPAFALAQDLLCAVRGHAERVVVLQVDEQIASLLAQNAHAPFALALGIGAAGVRVARQLNERSGWFPHVRRVEVTREEDGAGGYTLIHLGPTPLGQQLQDLAELQSLAIVDDTVFSGLTMRTVLGALPSAVLPRTHAFCLRGIAASLPALRALCAVSIGFAAPGRILDEVSFINATGLVLPIAIRRKNQPPLAFFERPEWMHAWFPGYAETVIALCRKLHAVLGQR